MVFRVSPVCLVCQERGQMEFEGNLHFFYTIESLAKTDLGIAQ